MIALWYRWTCESRIFCAADKESVMTIMEQVSLFSMADVRPMRMAISSASTGVTFIV